MGRLPLPRPAPPPGEAVVNSVRWLSLAATVGAYAVIVLGGYVSATGAGLACPDWPTCRGSFVPPFDIPGVAAEWSHRLATIVEGFLVLGLFVVVWWKHRVRRDLLVFTTAGFVLLVVQATIGMFTVSTQLNAALVTLHLATAVAFFAMVLLATVVAWWPVRGPGPGEGLPPAGSRSQP